MVSRLSGSAGRPSSASLLFALAVGGSDLMTAAGVEPATAGALPCPRLLVLTGQKKVLATEPDAWPFTSTGLLSGDEDATAPLAPAAAGPTSRPLFAWEAELFV
uniref:Putative secreted protein n=1 Tax=Ixodes ricinus TaxID=34613 RepID=A0A6B0UD10_IXORI